MTFNSRRRSLISLSRETFSCYLENENSKIMSKKLSYLNTCTCNYRYAFILYIVLSTILEYCTSIYSVNLDNLSVQYNSTSYMYTLLCTCITLIFSMRWISVSFCSFFLNEATVFSMWCLCLEYSLCISTSLPVSKQFA